MKILKIFIQIILLVAIPVFAQQPENPEPTNCIIYHVSGSKTWDVYVHGDEKAHWVASRPDLVKASKDCKNYFKERDQKDGNKSKTKDTGNKSN